MKYERFEDLPVWKAAIEFAVLVYALTANKAFRRHSSLRNQLEPADPRRLPESETSLLKSYGVLKTRT